VVLTDGWGTPIHPGWRVNRKFRLTRSEDFKRVRRLGKSYAHPLVVLVACPNELGTLRVGFAAGKSVGGAVERNRAKRQLRAILQAMMSQIPTGWDLIFLARQPILGATFLQIQQAVQGLIDRARLSKNDAAG
jgi:ribonuclease P protein component